MKTCRVGLAVGLCLVLFTLSGCKNKEEVPPSRGNPPVIIVGGSIHGLYEKGWSAQPAGTEYAGAVPDNSVLYFVHVYQAGKPLASLTAASGWRVNMYGQDSGGTAQGSPGAQLCSDPNCQEMRPDSTSVYFASGSSSGLELASSTELRFHNYGPACDQQGSSSENSRCDHIHHLGVITAGGSESRYECGGNRGAPQGLCEIWVGQAPPP